MKTLEELLRTQLEDLITRWTPTNDYRQDFVSEEHNLDLLLEVLLDFYASEPTPELKEHRELHSLRVATDFTQLLTIMLANSYTDDIFKKTEQLERVHSKVRALRNQIRLDDMDESIFRHSKLGWNANSLLRAGRGDLKESDFLQEFDEIFTFGRLLSRFQSSLETRIELSKRGNRSRVSMKYRSILDSTLCFALLYHNLTNFVRVDTVFRLVQAREKYRLEELALTDIELRKQVRRYLNDPPINFKLTLIK